MGKISLFIACSIDGYIAAPNNDLDFLSIVEDGNEDYGYHEFVNGVDTVIVGRTTYDWVLKHAAYPHTDKKSYVMSTREGENTENLQFYHGDLVQLAIQLKQNGQHVYCEGGAEIIHQLLLSDLIDEMIISYIPVLLGGGTSLFKPGVHMIKFKTESVKSYPKGLIQVRFKRERFN
jgi:dihydrofolate reductase